MRGDLGNGRRLADTRRSDEDLDAFVALVGGNQCVELRGEGLLLGMRAVVPNGELVDALRAEKLLTIAAGDNVVRLLPPLNITDEEIAEAVLRLDRAAGSLATSSS